ncbi:MAG TPA: hypothetical protein VE954_11385 [Oligoflexus sp.]|uniref:hypothetical protein n=1 Tax=Oligoflexus sp. TaxID=1971216 RepID=UPI002D2795F0|nr:hypothetical protein [Oligoflexus sp.]HYX33707.1 hypothetical protein [Oligoflexus sp.]
MFRTLSATVIFPLMLSSQTIHANAYKTCAAIRGNGDRIVAHFGAMGRYHESYPAFDGIAGGSSGSISSFLYESMRMNSLMTTCSGHACSPSEERLRLSFMLKSMLGYIEAYKETEEVQALLFTIETLQELKRKVQDKSFGQVVETDPEAAWHQLEIALSRPEFRGLVNPDLITLFQTSGNLRFHLKELQNNLANFGNWKAESPTVFFFPGFINWKEFARRIGRIADFYAGYGASYPAAAVDQVLSQCAEPMRGKEWPEPVAFGNTTCQKRWQELIGSYRTQNNADPTGPHRIDDRIGKGMMTLASTSVLVGPANLAAFRAAYARYHEGAYPDFHPVFSEIRVGYFGRDSDLARIKRNEQGYTDSRTQRFEPLGEKAWTDIISVSPAEPGLSEIRRVDDQYYSLGGWIDLSPTLVLRNAGCDEVVYFTRYVSQDQSGFARDVVKLLGASDSEVEQTIGANSNVTPKPSFILSNEEASGVWCTDWDAPAMGDFEGLFRTGFKGTFYTDSVTFTDTAERYAGIQKSRGKDSCIRD